jgi:hypothetical protein
MVSFPKIPTSSNDVGTLHWTLGVLQGQVDRINNAPPGSSTTKQKLVAWATASVFVMVSALVDEALHIGYFVAKAPFVGVKQIAKITGLGKYVTSTSLDVSDWVGHLGKARAVLFVFGYAVGYGFSVKVPEDQSQVLVAAKNLEVLSPIAGKRRTPAPATAPATAAAPANG